MKSFRGGIHLYEGKELAGGAAIVTVEAGQELLLPLSQHIGAPASPCVAVGDRVLRGQLIAEPTSFVSAGICSPVSGTVKAIEVRPLLRGKGMVIVLENDGQNESIPTLGEARDYTTLSAEEIRSLVSAAGVVGMGGAGFPTAVKMAPKDADGIKTVIINAAECEPYLTCDYRLLLERPEKVIGGLKVLLRLFPNAKGVLAVEDNKPDAIRLLKELTADEPSITVRPLKTKYPQGGERLMLHVVANVDIDSTRLPADVGCVVQNVSTAVAIYEAVCESRPLISRIVTLSGEGMANPGNFEVPLGTKFADLLAAAGGFVGEPVKLVAGGPMTGTAFTEMNIPVTKTTGGFLAFDRDDVSENATTACIRCGRCVSVCPEKLVPQTLATLASLGEFDKFEKLYGAECVECGCCSYVCPAYRPLTQNMKLGKYTVIKNRRANAAKK